MKLNIEELAREAGIETKLWNMGAASLVYTEGCHGVARSEFEAVIRLIVERCAQECDRLKVELFDSSKSPSGMDQMRKSCGMGAAMCATDIRNIMED